VTKPFVDVNGDGIHDAAQTSQVIGNLLMRMVTGVQDGDLTRFRKRYFRFGIKLRLTFSDTKLGMLQVFFRGAFGHS